MRFAGDQNETTVFNDLFREHFKGLCAYCQFKFELDLDAAKDAVHSSFIKLWESDIVFTSTESATSYLYKVITNICLDILRHEKTMARYLQIVQKDSGGGNGEDNNQIAEFKELQDKVNMAIAELPVQMREVFELSRNEGLKYLEIADKLGISVKTVETHMSRALHKLRDKLSSYLGICILLALIILFNKK